MDRDLVPKPQENNPLPETLLRNMWDNTLLTRKIFDRDLASEHKEKQAFDQDLAPKHKEKQTVDWDRAAKSKEIHGAIQYSR